MSQSEDIPADLWSFSLERYARSGISATCLDLQDRLDADINVVLLCLWAGQRGTALTTADIRAILAGGAAGWRRDAVVPLRTARRHIKTWNAPRGDPAIEAFRDKVKALELEAERFAQRLLAGAFAERFGTGATSATRVSAPSAIAADNLTAYLEIIAWEASDSWRPRIETLVASCID